MQNGVTASQSQPMIFEYSWKRTVDPKTASPQAYYFEGLKNYRAIVDGGKSKEELGVTAIDDHTFGSRAKLSYELFSTIIGGTRLFIL